MNNFASLVEPLNGQNMGFGQPQTMSSQLQNTINANIPMDKVASLFGDNPLAKRFGGQLDFTKTSQLNGDPTAMLNAAKSQAQPSADPYGDLQKKYANYAFTPVDHNPFGQLPSNVTSGMYGSG